MLLKFRLFKSSRSQAYSHTYQSNLRHWGFISCWREFLYSSILSPSSSSENSESLPALNGVREGCLRDLAWGAWFEDGEWSLSASELSAATEGDAAFALRALRPFRFIIHYLSSCYDKFHASKFRNFWDGLWWLWHHYLHESLLPVRILSIEDSDRQAFRWGRSVGDVG